MITLQESTVDKIKRELESIPEKYQKPFNSMHEGYAVLLEEVRELEKEIFWGEKEAAIEATSKNLSILFGDSAAKEEIKSETQRLHKLRVKDEAIQVAAMACRIIQELT